MNGIFVRTDCAAVATFDVVANKWSSLVVYALAHGARRNGELRTLIPTISQKVLTETLRRLERDGLVSRTDTKSHPPKVAYELTVLGGDALQLLSEICRWGKAHLPEVSQARRSFDEQWPDGPRFKSVEWTPSAAGPLAKV